MGRPRSTIHTRQIKPGFWDNEVLAEMSSMVRLLFVGLWCLADRDGQLEDRPGRIRRKLNLDELEDSDKALQQLADSGFIVRCTRVLRGKPGKIDSSINVIHINNFAEHQSVHPKEAPGVFHGKVGVLHSEPSEPSEPSDSPLTPQIPALKTARGVVPFDQIIGELNSRTGGQARASAKGNQTLIKALWKQGHRLDDFLSVIKWKCDEWQGDSHMDKHLKPSVLFRASNFEKYLADGPPRAAVIPQQNETFAERRDRLTDEAAAKIIRREMENEFEIRADDGSIATISEDAGFGTL